MTESSSDKLIEVLRKAVSRTSLLAEGNDPELDSVVRQIRQATTQGVDAKVILDVLNNAEPFLIKNDQAQMNRAKQVRSTLLKLIDLLEEQESKTVPHKEKKQLEVQIQANWKLQSQWPQLLNGFLTLAEKTFSQTENSHESSNHSLFKRLFSRSSDSEKTQSNQEIMMRISHTLAGLMNNLQLPNHYNDDIADLVKALQNSNNIQQLPGLMDEVINFVMIAIGKTQEGLANYLTQLNKQLVSINQTVTSSYNSQKSLSETREGFNNTLQMQMNDTSQAMVGINDLDSLKSLINDRLSTISNTMSEHRQQMQEREKQANQSIALLKNKVVRMEKDSSSLRSLLQEKLALAMTDSLTGLPNRTAYQDTSLPLCKIMQKTKKTICLAVCDIDHFKNINDTWGHLAGDKVLRLIPKQIRNALVKEDLIFRYGGEEFVILFPNTTLAEAIDRAETIRAAVEKTPFNMQGEPVSVSVSIGIAELRAQESSESLFSRADKNLYLAKESGRNKVIANK